MFKDLNPLELKEAQLDRQVKLKEAYSRIKQLNVNPSSCTFAAENYQFESEIQLMINMINSNNDEGYYSVIQTLYQYMSANTTWLKNADFVKESNAVEAVLRALLSFNDYTTRSYSLSFLHCCAADSDILVEQMVELNAIHVFNILITNFGEADQFTLKKSCNIISCMISFSFQAIELLDLEPGFFDLLINFLLKIASEQKSSDFSTNNQMAILKIMQMILVVAEGYPDMLIERYVQIYFDLLANYKQINLMSIIASSLDKMISSAPIAMLLIYQKGLYHEFALALRSTDYQDSWVQVLQFFINSINISEKGSELEAQLVDFQLLIPNSLEFIFINTNYNIDARVKSLLLLSNMIAVREDTIDNLNLDQIINIANDLLDECSFAQKKDVARFFYNLLILAPLEICSLLFGNGLMEQFVTIMDEDYLIIDTITTFNLFVSRCVENQIQLNTISFFEEIFQEILQDWVSVPNQAIHDMAQALYARIYE